MTAPDKLENTYSSPRYYDNTNEFNTKAEIVSRRMMAVSIATGNDANELSEIIEEE
jgi:hypothetical protein